jgi:hypothetical protein
METYSWVMSPHGWSAFVSKPLTPRWQRSSYCKHASDCVEMTQLAPGTIGVRDSAQETAAPILGFSVPAIRSLVAQIKQGDLELG